VVNLTRDPQYPQAKPSNNDSWLIKFSDHLRFESVSIPSGHRAKREPP
jgi:hypothetical protein